MKKGGTPACVDRIRQSGVYLRHPSQVAELAKALGRYVAEQEYRRLIGALHVEEAEDGGTLR